MASTEMKPEQQAAVVELQGLLKRAKTGDLSAVPRLREYLDLNPILWKHPGDVGLQAQAAWIKLIAGKNLHLRECVVRRINAWKRELAGNSPAPLEVLLIERVIAAQLRLAYIEACEAQHDEQSIRWAEFNLKKQIHAERQLRAAVDALEAVRKASRPITVELRQPVAVPQPEPTADGMSNGNTRKAAHANHVPTNGVAVPINRINGSHNGNRVAHLLDSLVVGAEG